MIDELHQRAETGEPDACMQLAKRLMRGRGVERDYEKAVRLFDTAARAGDTDALYRLAKCYLKGIGCLKDPSGAVSLLETAARRGHATAAVRLGDCFATGEGAPLSTPMAAYWYRKAAALGASLAFDKLLQLR